MKILKRLWPHRPIQVALAAALGVMSVLGATLGFAGTASAATPSSTTPVSFYDASVPQTVDNAFTLAPGALVPTIPVGTSSAPAAAWAFQLNDAGLTTGGTNSNSATGVSETWAAGDSIFIPIFEATDTPTTTGTPAGVAFSLEANAYNNVSTGAYVAFTGTPSMTCVGGGSNVTQPTFVLSTMTNPADNLPTTTAALKDVLVITFTNNPIVGSPAPFDCFVHVDYQVGPAFATNSAGGAVVTYGPNGDQQPTFVQATVNAGLIGAGILEGSTYTQSATSGAEALNFVTQTATGTNTYEEGYNAIISTFTVQANNPPVSVLPNALNAPISNITGSETFTNQMEQGYVCITAAEGSFVVTPTSPTISVTPSNTGGTATVSPGVFGAAGSVQANGSYKTIVADVLSVSSTVPTTFTISGLVVDAPAAVGAVTVSVTIGAGYNGSTCTSGFEMLKALKIYAVGQPTSNTRIAGSNADQTAVAALEYKYPPQEGYCLDQGVHPNPSRFSTGSSVVLATDGSWQDALTASYLASYYQTGVLLTPTDTLSPYTLQAIQQEGVTNVFIVGGPLAVSQAVQNQLASTAAYQCGGAAPQLNSLGQPIHLSVQRIYGANADATAEAVDTFVNSGYVGTLNMSGMFGKYNTTTGTDSGSSPTIAVRTAVLVTDGFFQDAASASSMAYYEGYPIILTPTSTLGTAAETTLLDLGIQQVIELGGPLAIANSVNSTLEAQGISVLRIAGTDGSETSVMLAAFELAPNPYGLGWSSANNSCSGNAYEYAHCVTVALIRGDYFADALTSSVVTGAHYSQAGPTGPMPIILTESPTSLGAYATAFFNQAGGPFGVDPEVKLGVPQPGTGTGVNQITVFGGPLAVAQSVLQAAFEALSAG